MNNYLIIAFTIAFSAFFSGMEIAFVSAGKLRIELDKKRGMLSAKIISRFVQEPSRFIGAMLIGNNITLVVYSIAAAAVLDQQMAQWLPEATSKGVLLALQTILSTLVILVMAEFMPKIIFRINPNAALNLFAIPVYLIYLLLYPFMYLYLGIAEYLLKIFINLKTGKTRYRFSAIDFAEYIMNFDSSAATDNVNADEIQMIQNVMEFHTTKVRECMIPRNEIIAVEENDSIEDLRKEFLVTQHSKILVYRQTIDNLTGYVHLFDLFGKPDNLLNVIRPVIFIPETIPAHQVLDKLISQRKSVAVVVDEFGGTAGMVTVEDLIEEIFGEIHDEYDVQELVEKQNARNEFVLAGRLEIDYLNKEYDLALPVSEEYETLAGLILSRNQSIPHKLDQISIGRFTFIILEASGNRIDKVLLRIAE